MVADIIETWYATKGEYPEKVKDLMKSFKRTLVTINPSIKDKSTEKRLVQYDYDSYCLQKRIEGSVSGIKEARKKLSGVINSAQLDALFVYSNAMIMKGGYNWAVDQLNVVTLSSAIWILDELLLSDDIEKIYQYLPVCDKERREEIKYLPVNHPIHENDLIFSLFYLICHRNTSKPIGENNAGTLVWKQPKADPDEQSLKYRTDFSSVIDLLNPESVNAAVQHFEDKVWEFYRLTFSIMIAVDKRIKVLTKERDDLQKRIKGLIDNAKKPQNVLLMPYANGDNLINLGEQELERLQSELQQLQNEINRLSCVTFTCLSLPNDREKLVISLKGIIADDLVEELIAFHVDDPFETAFALLYLLDTNSKIPWFYFGSISVGYTMCDQLPYDVKPEIPQKKIRLSNWNSALYRHSYKGYRFDGRVDATGEPVTREYAKNLSQLVFANTMSLIPRVVPEQAILSENINGWGGLSEREKEAYSLLSYALVAGQLRTYRFNEYRAVQILKQLLEERQEDSYQQINDDAELLREENERLRAKNRELVEMVGGVLDERKSESKQVKLLQHQIELQEKELSDLRETVYLLKNDDNYQSSTDDKILYPYATSCKIVSFGGHDMWLKEMRKKLPNVMFFSPESLPNIDLIRNADTVWLQTNCLSHSDFFRIINTVRQNGIPLRYFSFSGSEKCAEQLVKSLN